MRVDTGHTGKGEATGDDNDRCDVDVSKDSRAPDGGWGWMVALGSFIATTVLFSLPYSFSILYSEYLLSNGTSATAIAWIFSVLLVLMNFSVTLSNALAQEFGRRTVGFISIFMCFLSIISSTFSSSIYFLYFSYSFVGGVGAGLCEGIAVTALPPYFNEKSGRANTFLSCGAPMSQMVFAPLIRYLMELYSYRGAALVYSGILLNGLIGVSLLQPVKWHLKLSSGAAGQPRQDAMQALLCQGEDHSPAAATTSEVPHKSSTPQVPPSTPVNQSLQSLRWTPYRSVGSIMSATSADVPIGLAVLSVEKSTGNTKPGCATSFGRILGRVAAKIKSDLMVVRHFRAVILAVTFMITQSSSMNFIMILPYVVCAADHTLQDAAWCISLLGMTNLVMRLVISPIADWKKFSIRYSIMTGYCLKAVAMTVASFTSELWLLASAAVMFGLGLSASVNLSNLSIIKYMGMNWLAQTFGVMCLMTSLGFVVIGPFLGVIRDMTSTYAVSLQVMAALELLSAGLWLLMPAAQARDATREHKGNTACSLSTNT